MILFIYKYQAIENESVLLLVVQMPDTKAGRFHWIRLAAVHKASKYDA